MDNRTEKIKKISSHIVAKEHLICSLTLKQQFNEKLTDSMFLQN
jgi:hypothetical protein